MAQTKSKGIWWLTPSLLEAVDGPWGAVGDGTHDPARGWRRIIDWAAALRVERIATSLEPYRIDRVVTQWGLHYVCRFPDDPAARCFDDRSVDRHIDIARRIASYGQSRGVKLMLHHYNFIAPERWIDAHPALAEKLDAVDDAMWGWRFHPDRLGFLVGHVCWNDPAYRAFMDRCWAEALGNIPELAGLMVTPGEFSYCRCDACRRPGAHDVFEHLTDDGGRDADPRLLTALNFLTHFQRRMAALGREGIVRTWGIERYMDRLPDDGLYASKFAVFDAAPIGPDPTATRWAESGKRVFATHAIEAENSGPLIWHDERWNVETADRLNAMRGPGTFVHINVHWGHAGHVSTFVAGCNIQRTLERLEPAVTPGDSRREFEARFGPGRGESVRTAAALVAAVPLGLTSVIHLRGEGHTHHLQPWFFGPWRWPGVLGHPDMDPPDWANPDGLVTLTQLMRRVEADADALTAMLDAPQRDVIGKADELAASADEAARLLDRVMADGDAELAMLHDSAEIAGHRAREIADLLRARLAWHAVGCAPDVAAAERAQARAIQCFERSIEAVRAQLAPSLRIAQTFPDYACHVVTSRDPFYRLPLATHLKIRLRELATLREVSDPAAADARPVQFQDFIESVRRRPTPQRSAILERTSP